jgi:hypothetical protein
MADQITLGHMNPYAGIVIAGRTRQNEELIPGVEPGQVPGAGAENGPVNGGPEGGRVLGRKRRRGAVVHHPPI